MTPGGPSLGAFVDVTSDDPGRWADQLTRVRGLPGLGHVELWLETLPSSPARRRELADLVAGLPVIMHAPFIGLSLVTAWPELRAITLDRLEAAAAAGAEAGASVMTVHPGQAATFEDDGVVTGRLAEALAELRDRTRGGPTVSVENMPCRRGAVVDGLVTLAQCRELVARDPAVRITLDVGHALQNGDDHVRFLNDHADAVADVHLHDGVENGPGHLRLGTGAIDLDAFADGVQRSGFAGHVTLETLGWPDTAASYASAAGALCMAGARSRVS